jgi:ATP-dependent Lon protease
LKEIKKELDEDEEEDENVKILREKAANKSMPDEVKEKFDTELERLQKIPSMSPEYTVLYSYIEWIADLPWGIVTQDNKEIQFAEDILEKEHYGLETPKERLLDYIAIRQSIRSQGPDICLVGPPDG